MKSPIRAIQRFQTLEELAGGSSCLHQLSPFAKLCSTLLFLIFVVSFDLYQVSSLIPFFLYPIIFLILAEIPLSILGSTLLLAFPFIFFTALSNIFFNSAVFFTFGDITITYGMISACSLLLKYLLTVSAVTLLIATTPLTELCKALCHLRIPNLFIVQFLLCFRYIGVLLEEAHQMSLAYSLRNPKQKNLHFRHVGQLIGQLLLRSYFRADRIYTAMQQRGFQLSLQTPQQLHLSSTDKRYLILVILSLLFLKFVNVPYLLGALLTY